MQTKLELLQWACACQQIQHCCLYRTSALQGRIAGWHTSWRPLTTCGG